MLLENMVWGGDVTINFSGVWAGSSVRAANIPKRGHLTRIGWRKSRGEF